MEDKSDYLTEENQAWNMLSQQRNISFSAVYKDIQQIYIL